MITALLLQLMLVDLIGGGTADYDYTIIRGNRAFSLDYYWLQQWGGGKKWLLLVM